MLDDGMMSHTHDHAMDLLHTILSRHGIVKQAVTILIQHTVDHGAHLIDAAQAHLALLHSSQQQLAFAWEGGVTN